MIKTISTYSLIFALCLLMVPSAIHAGTNLPGLDKAIQKYLEQEWGKGNVEWIPFGNQRNLDKYADADIRIREREKPRGKTVLQVELIEDRRVVRTIPYRIEITAFATIPVLTEDLGRNEEINGSIIHWERRNVSTIRNEWVINQSTFTNEVFWTRQRMKKGDILYKRNIEKKPEVVMGDPVTIVVSNGGVNLSVPGIARQSGEIGDIIKVVNTQYNRILKARVEDRSLVVLESGRI